MVTPLRLALIVLPREVLLIEMNLQTPCSFSVSGAEVGVADGPPTGGPLGGEVGCDGPVRADTIVLLSTSVKHNNNNIKIYDLFFIW